MNFFLRIKHWQFFLLAFVLPMTFYIAFISILLTGNNDLTNTPVFIFLLAFMAVTLFMNTGWQYTIGVNLHKRLPFSVPMPLKRFKWFLFIPIVYIALIIFAFMPLAMNNMDPESPDNSFPIALSVALLLIIPLHLFSIFCMFYTLYYNAKSLKAVETQRPVTFSDFAGEFFLLWFLPVGIWIIQPRINKIFSEEYNDHNFSFMNDSDQFKS